MGGILKDRAGSQGQRRATRLAVDASEGTLSDNDRIDAKAYQHIGKVRPSQSRARGPAFVRIRTKGWVTQLWKLYIGQVVAGLETPPPFLV